MDIDSNLNALVDALKNTIGKFADKDGVSVHYNQTQPIVRFTFKTEDKLALDIKYEINKTNEEYIGSMMIGIHNALQRKRKERHESPIIILQ